MARRRRVTGSARRAVLWLLPLAALLALSAHASTPHSSAATLAVGSDEHLFAPNLAASLVDALEPLDEASRFELGEASLLAEPRSERFHLTGAELLNEEPRRAPPLSYPETRVRGFDFLGQEVIGVFEGATLELHWGCRDFGLGISEGNGVNLYAFVGQRPHEATDPLGTDALYEGVQAAAQNAPALRLIIGGGGVAAAPVLSSASMYTPHGLLVLGGLLAIGTPFQIKLIDAEADAYMAEANAKGQQIKLEARRRQKALSQVGQEFTAFLQPAGPYADPDSPYWSQLQSMKTTDSNYLSLLIRHRTWVEEKAKKEKAPRKREDTGLHRPYLRAEVIAAVLARAGVKDGKVCDANTNCAIEGAYHIGHVHGHEFWREREFAESVGMSQEQFNDYMNNPDFYQVEDPKNNQSHKYEKPKP